MSSISETASPKPGTGAAKTSPTSEADSLYARHRKIYPKDITGTFRRAKYLTLSVLLLVYYITPWLRWDRGPDSPDQAVLFDIPGRRLYFFFIELWPQQIYILTGVMVFSAIALFMATAMYGRLWCGFACPQTVWTDLFLWIERKVEGDHNQRRKLDAGPWNKTRITRKAIKHSLWLVVSAITGATFVFYVVDAPTTTRELLTFNSTSTVVGFTALFGGLCYLLAGFAREQVCFYMCPWPRFQAVMQDEESKIVTYEEWRGEPRAFYRKAVDWPQREKAGVGDCVDCGNCNTVCPTGIDIRRGNQLQCIGCGLCIDACNDVMKKLGRPGELITFDTENAQVARANSQKPVYRPFRPRILMYAGVLSAVAAVMVATMMLQSRLEVSVLRDRAPMFVELSNGDIRNTYTFKIVNMEREAHNYTLSVRGLTNGTLAVLDRDDTWQPQIPLSAAADNVTSYRVFVRAPRSGLTAATQPVTFILSTPNGTPVATYTSPFMGPH